MASAGLAHLARVRQRLVMSLTRRLPKTQAASQNCNGSAIIVISYMRDYNVRKPQQCSRVNCRLILDTRMHN
jgi:hypothetical protein